MRFIENHFLRAIVLAQLTLSLFAQQSSADPSNPNVRLADLSVNLLVAGGGSSADAEQIGALQSGGHDPRRNGFTLQGAEISVSGAVDPYFTAEAYILAGEDEVELEEAYLTSLSLPHGLQLKAGKYLTEFGRINPTHPHQWYWLDQPIIAGRLLGADGLRSTGARIAWLVPLPWYAQLIVGAQNASDESAISFLGEGHAHGHAEASAGHEEDHASHDDGHEMAWAGGQTIGGRPRIDRMQEDLEDLLYNVRLEQAFDLTPSATLLFGLSSIIGPNAASEDGTTYLFGADLTLKWRSANARQGAPFVVWQTEWMSREFKTGELTIPHDDHEHHLPDKTLRDWGVYSQIVWGFAPRWETGLRIEYATGNESEWLDREEDPMRADRVRVSPMLAYRPSEYSRIRVQYNFDDADFLDDNAHSLWVGLEVGFGAHPAHSF